MVVVRLFGRRPWLADAETCSAVNGKLMQLGLVERVCAERETSRITPLGKELDVDLFQVFFGVIYEWDVPFILEHYRFLDGSEADAIFARMSKDNADSILPPR